MGAFADRQLILMTACINYMNLATARSQRRAREVGIRKTVGARMGQIMTQFFVESGFITLTGVLVAVVVAEARPAGGERSSGKNISNSII